MFVPLDALKLLAVIAFLAITFGGVQLLIKMNVRGSVIKQKLSDVSILLFVLPFVFGPIEVYFGSMTPIQVFYTYFSMYLLFSQVSAIGTVFSLSCSFG
jgi:hypothetical protein